VTDDETRRAAMQIAGSVFADALASGMAVIDTRLTQTPFPVRAITVTPTNPNACSVTIMADSQQIDLLLGPHETLREIYEEDRLLDELRACLEGVANGEYEETVEGGGTTISGYFRNGPERYVRHGRDFGPDRVTRFEAY
jgi:hypothetical protein